MALRKCEIFFWNQEIFYLTEYGDVVHAVVVRQRRHEAVTEARLPAAEAANNFW